MAEPFKYRKGYRAQVQVSGQRETAYFKKKIDARHWIEQRKTYMREGGRMELGGPTHARLADMLLHYAKHYTAAKGGVVAELNRIGHYLEAAGLPLLRAQRTGENRFEVVEVTPEAVEVSVPGEKWRAYRQARLKAREKTYAFIGRLARKRAARITKLHIRALKVRMKEDGLSASTIQKEIALLRHVFNMAIEEWGWRGFTNPAAGIKLGKSEPRFVTVGKTDISRLVQALSECDNPYFWPLVDVAIHSLGRLDSLLRLQWHNVDLENRVLQFPSKTGTVRVPLDLRVVQVLAAMPRHPSGKVFPMSKNAVRCAWNGVRVKAGLPKLQFRDLRHVGATQYARRIPDPHVIRLLLAHKSDAMARVYVNFANEDVFDKLDRSRMPEGEAAPLPPAAMAFTTEAMAQKKAARAIAGRKAQLARDRGGSDAPAAPASQPATEPAPRAAPAQRTAQIISFPLRRTA